MNETKLSTFGCCKIVQTNKDESELDISFEKLNFGTSKNGKTKQTNNFAIPNDDPIPPPAELNLITFEENLLKKNVNKETIECDVRLIQKFYRNKKKKRNKSILQKATLVLPKEFQTTKVKHNNKDYSTDTSNSLHREKCLCVKSCHCDKKVVSCGTQFLYESYRANICSNATEAETNPDELASYFEQMLYIPKPMSLMAEMMYA